jgi:uncharacterized spore protein YtfJ
LSLGFLTIHFVLLAFGFSGGGSSTTTIAEDSEGGSAGAGAY